MAKIRDLKKMINYELSGVIESCYEFQLMKPKEADKAEKIIDQAIEAFDNLIEKVNENNIELYKKHFTSVKKALFSTKDDLLKKLDKL